MILFSRFFQIWSAPWPTGDEDLVEGIDLLDDRKT